MWVISALLGVGTSSAGSGIGEEYFQGVETHKPKKKKKNTNKNRFTTGMEITPRTIHGG